METLSKEIIVHLTQQQAFSKFVDEISEWWPSEYTWSQDTLKDIRIETNVNGHCTETGPNDFRCDWGTVTAIEKGKYLAFRWQISPSRLPVPDPAKASIVKVIFSKVADNKTKINLQHSDFKNHGDGYKEYFAAMNSEKGWVYILNCYANFCDT